MEILIVRHGQSVGDIEERHEGRADFSLTDLGRLQAQRVATWIKDHYPPTKIISSPLIRASYTAEQIAKNIDINITFDDDLMEWNNGLLAGMLKKEALIKYPVPESGRRPHDDSLECESFIDFRSRAERFWSKMIYSETHKRICIVSHGGMINMLYRCFLSLPMQTEVNIRTGDTGVHLWRIDEGRRVIEFSNFMGHLNN